MNIIINKIHYNKDDKYNELLNKYNLLLDEMNQIKNNMNNLFEN